MSLSGIAGKVGTVLMGGARGAAAGPAGIAAGIAGSILAPMLIDYLFTDNPTPEDEARIKGTVDQLAAARAAQEGISIDAARKAVADEVEPLLREAATKRPGVFVNLLAGLAGFAGGANIAGRLMGKGAAAVAGAGAAAAGAGGAALANAEKSAASAIPSPKLPPPEPFNPNPVPSTPVASRLVGPTPDPAEIAALQGEMSQRVAASKARQLPSLEDMQAAGMSASPTKADPLDALVSDLKLGPTAPPATVATAAEPELDQLAALLNKEGPVTSIPVDVKSFKAARESLKAPEAVIEPPAVVAAAPKKRGRPAGPPKPVSPAKEVALSVEEQKRIAARERREARQRMGA